MGWRGVIRVYRFRVKKMEEVRWKILIVPSAASIHYNFQGTTLPEGSVAALQGS